MATLDPRLRYMLDELRDQPAAPGGEEEAGAPVLAERVGWEAADGGTVEVLVHGYDTDLGTLTPGAAITSLPTWSSVITAVVPVDELPLLAENPQVERVEASRPLFPDLAISRPEVRADLVHDGVPAERGHGVIVAVIDSGIDYTHPNFRNNDGTSRILFLWDQSAPAAGGVAVPFGREYTKEDLDLALKDPNPLSVVPHRDDLGGHGTHVAGIAAGNERGRNDYSGMAPEADIILVALAGGDGTLGRSAHLAAAANYVVDRAAGRPVALNISQGMNGGGHSGETLVERSLDEIARLPGVVIIKSAGNEQTWDIHAGGQIGDGEVATLDLVVRQGNVQDDIIEVWFAGSDGISIGLDAPSGPSSPLVPPGEERRFTTAAGNRVAIISESDKDGTGDTAVTLIITRGNVARIEPGVWRLVLRSDTVRVGRYDAWIERAPRTVSGEQTTFAVGSVDPTRTISVPGTARRVITVGSYVTRPRLLFDANSLGRLSRFSSRGPTRLGLRKPELAAPGESIISARPANSSRPMFVDGQHTAMEGTSMAAPHVAGAAALVLAVQPRLTSDAVKQLLVATARRDGRTTGAPDDAWGAGRLDVAAAVEAARNAAFPTVTSAAVDGTSLAVETAEQTHAVLRFGLSPTQLAIGKVLGTRVSAATATAHRFELGDLEPGRYVCEVVVTASSGLSVVEDANGRFHEVVVAEGHDVVSGEPAEPAANVSPAAREDDLERIRGIGPKVAARLREAGLTTFTEVAHRSPAELAAAAHSANISADRVADEDWVGQAAKLAVARHEPIGSEAARPGAAPNEPRARHSFMLTLTTGIASHKVLNCHIEHHQTHDQRDLVGLGIEELASFIEDKANVHLAPRSR